MNLSGDSKSNCFWIPYIHMYLDKIYTLQTGTKFKIATSTLQELIANAITRQEFSELEKIRCITDLYAYLSVIVYEGAEDLVKRRQRWTSKKMKANLIAGRSVLFREFGHLFWRNIDEDDPDGDEWHRLIASDCFYSELTGWLHKLRIAEQNICQSNKAMPELYFELA